MDRLLFDIRCKMSRARKLFPEASEEYVEFADSFFEKAESVTYTEDDFWRLVERCRDRLDAIPVDPYVAHEYEVFGPEIQELTTEQLYHAAQHFSKMFWALHRKEIWSAICVIEKWCSDDGFRDFREWLMTCGKSACEEMLRDPDSLADIVQRYKRTTTSSEGVFMYTIWGEFEDRTGFELPMEDPDSKLKGEWIDEDKVQTALPKCHKLALETQGR